MTFIFDLDGTIFDLSHRLHYLGITSKDKWVPFDAPKDWNAFYDASKDDELIAEVATVWRTLQAAGHYIIVVTGRPERVRFSTVERLHKEKLYFNSLYMRQDKDHREDYVLKSEILDTILRDEAKVIHGVFEDRQQVVDMYRERGIRVFQVANGKY